MLKLMSLPQAFGTVTSVCNGLVRGFGHPFNLLGKTTYAMTGADTLYIQEDPVGPPFTVANFGTPLGTITQDRLAGVSGPIGPLPAGATVSNTVTYGASSRTKSSARGLEIRYLSSKRLKSLTSLATAPFT